MKYRTPSLLAKADQTLASFTATGRALFLFFAGLCLVSSVALVYILESSIVVSAPARGGSLSEGLIGSPRFINPVLAVSDADRDLSALVYSGLLKATPTGDYTPNLAERYEISPDGITYTFYLRANATFHDGTSVTADDVVFTITKAQDASLKSPQRANWDGVSVAAVDSHTVRFTLKAPYAPFIENMTLGILPKHLWQDVSDEEFPFSELNTSPTGSGPYKVRSISRSQGGIPSSYTLSSFTDYALGEPYLTTLTLRFYQSEQALENAVQSGDVEAASGLSPANLELAKDQGLKTAALNRVFGVFFNQNQSEVLRDHAVRAALNSSINRQDLVQSVLGGYGTPLNGPLPPSVAPSSQTVASTSGDSAIAAQQQLLKAGWQIQNNVLVKTTGKGSSAKTQTLAFTLATANVPELRAAADYLKREWARMGAQVTVQVYEQGDLSQNVIRPRKYDALLFGEVVGRELDLFAFWDSSQRNDPGLNIALYANATADSALDTMRQTQDENQRKVAYQAFANELAKDIPAVFLYAPDFVYTVPNDLQGLDLGFIETPSDRYLSVAEWHRDEDYVWPIFLVKKK
jgi:peptide/nickel transport system substrate-binding protein